MEAAQDEKGNCRRLRMTFYPVIPRPKAEESLSQDDKKA
jgi:hypothetical protein